MRYSFDITTFLGIVSVVFPDAEYQDPVETETKYLADSAFMALSEFLNRHGVGANGVRFDISFCSPIDLIRTLEINDSYHHDSYIVSWEMVDGEVPEEFSGGITESSLSEAAREAMGHEDATIAQKEAGNYKKGKCRIAGFDITIENPAGSYRTGTSPDGKEWKSLMSHHYGYIGKTEAIDGDAVDVFFNPDIADEEFENKPWFIIDQIDLDGNYDEAKIIAGYNTKSEAKAAYMANYSSGWEGLGDITQMNLDEFRSWVTDKEKVKKPVSWPASTE